VTAALERTRDEERINRRGLVVVLLLAVAVAGWIAWRAFSAPVLEDGEHFVLVTAFRPSTITVDPALFLIGEPAREAARDAGAIGPDEELPDPFYIQNPDVERVVLKVAGGFRAHLINAVTLEFGTPLDAEAFAHLFDGQVMPETYGFTPEGFPMTIRVANGQAIRAEQQYVP
jgi:hypothetical protein